jgi:hypothetical protein
MKGGGGRKIPKGASPPLGEDCLWILDPSGCSEAGSSKC